MEAFLTHLFLARVTLYHPDSLPSQDLVIMKNGYVPFPFGKGGSGVLANCSLCVAVASLSNMFGSVCLSFFSETCVILQALRWFPQCQQNCLFFFLPPPLKCLLCRCYASSPSFYLALTGISGRNYPFFTPLCTIRLQWFPGYSFHNNGTSAESAGLVLLL